jgi:hypothetical protein
MYCGMRRYEQFIRGRVAGAYALLAWRVAVVLERD